MRRLAPELPISPEPYHPRDTQDSVLVNLLREHLDSFIAQTEADGGRGVPAFVVRQLRAMIDCGDLTRGFVRLECRSCRGPRIVPFSCKARLCPSCAGRRMSDQAFHLVDRVLRRAPYRQWVLTLPWNLARAVAFDTGLCNRVFWLFADELARWQCARARAAGVDAPRAGSILEIQRFADAARLWPHAHLLAPDGVFHETAAGQVRFHGIGPPRDHDVAAIVGRVTDRVKRLVERRAAAAADREEADAPERQLLLQCADVEPCDQIVVEGSSEPQARRAMSRRARARKPLCARSPEGLELHAAVRVTAGDRAGLEHLCKYMARPPICDGRLSRLPDGRIEVRLKRAWRGGVRALVFQPVAFIARLAALIPRPKTPMRRFYGVFAPAHSWRSRVVPRPPCPDTTGRPVAPPRPARMTWSDLLKRTFDIDALRCGYCSGRLVVVSAVHNPSAIQAIIAAVQVADTRAEQHRAHAAPRGPPCPAPGRAA